MWYLCVFTCPNYVIQTRINYKISDTNLGEQCILLHSDSIIWTCILGTLTCMNCIVRTHIKCHKLSETIIGEWCALRIQILKFELWKIRKLHYWVIESEHVKHNNCWYVVYNALIVCMIYNGPIIYVAYNAQTLV